MNDHAAARQFRERERHILAAMDRRNRILRLRWLLAGPMPDQQTRQYFEDLLRDEESTKGENGHENAPA